MTDLPADASPDFSRGLPRRRLLGSAAAAFATAAAGPSLFAAEVPSAPPPAAARGPNERIRVAVIGLGSRGMALAPRFAAHPNTEVAYVADVDIERTGKAAEAIGRLEGVAAAPKPLVDFRRFLDDGSVDLVVVATCNHWHAPAAIMACNAGKHVYVEKPCSHNPWEGEMLVAAARKHDRRVQMGNQRRSWSGIRRAIGEIHEGVIGRPYLAQSFYSNKRPSIGHGKAVPVPTGLDWDLWQGPAPRREFHDNYLPYHWHWFWDWGNGELGNNGVHALDVCRWGLGVGYPTRVESAGGRYRYQDDQQTPDTQVVSFGFEDGRTITWQGLSCNLQPESATRRSDVIFYGDKGSLAILGSSYTVFDEAGKEIRTERGDGADIVHTRNLLDAIREGTPLASEIGEGHISTLYCHLGNIAQRVGRSLRCNPADGHIVDDAAAMKLWKRDYEPGWEPKA
jgi:predicted dehydrogenase